MKGKEIQISELELGKEYWVEHSGKDWLEDTMDDGVHSCEMNRGEMDLLDDKNTFIGINNKFEGYDYSVTIYEIAE